MGMLQYIAINNGCHEWAPFPSPPILLIFGIVVGDNVKLTNQVDNTSCCKDAYDKVNSYEPFLLDLTGSIMYDYFADIKDSYKSIASFDYFALNDTLHKSDEGIVKDGAVKDAAKKKENHRLHLAIGAALQYCGDPTYNSSLYLFRRYECDDEVKKGSDAIKSFLDDKTTDKLSKACAAQLKALKCRTAMRFYISAQYIEWVGPWMRLFELIYKSIAATYFEHAVDMQLPVCQNVALRGMSLYWSQWKGQFYNAEVIKALKCSWNTNVFRAAMAVDNGGYLTNPNAELAKITTVVQAAIDLGMYVIIDWHTDVTYQAQAVAFFGKMAQKYAGVPNAIRKYDTKNIIIVGTPNWSQDVDVASKNPIKNQTNIMYTLHYYAGEHKQWLRDKAQTALNNGLPIFITEYGTTNTQAKGSVDVAESNAWWSFVDKNQISQANWGMDDVDENTAAVAVELKPLLRLLALMLV
uniref:Glycoside hydrolase family 5 domain-containing protein n=1 Tax=Ditylenchus dipsaci TaxID=166011 RepID=A0A915DNP0_9BILA